jgi:hypothetical protein
MNIAKAFWQAYRGRQLWLGLKKEYKLTDWDWAMLFPSDSEEETALALGLVKSFYQFEELSGEILLIFCREEFKILAESFPFPQKGRVAIGREACESLLKLYSFYHFEGNFIVASLDKPAGRKAGRLLGYKGLSRFDLYQAFVFRLPHDTGTGNGGNGP